MEVKFAVSASSKRSCAHKSDPTSEYQRHRLPRAYVKVEFEVVGSIRFSYSDRVNVAKFERIYVPTECLVQQGERPVNISIKRRKAEVGKGEYAGQFIANIASDC